MNRKSWLALFLMIAVCMTAACQKSADKLVEETIKQQSGEEVEVDTDKDGGITLKTEDGKISAGSKAKVPESFPSSFPLPSDSTLISAVEVQNTWSLTYQVKSPEVVEALVEVFKERNFALIASADYGQMKTWIFENDTHNVSFNILMEEDNYVATYFVGMKE